MVLKNTAVGLHSAVPPDWYHRSIYIDKNIFQKFVHERRFKKIGYFIEPTRGRILDIGCADGVFTKIILDRSGAKEIIAVDVLESSIRWAKKHWRKEKRIQFRVVDAHKLPYRNFSFDAVFALEVLEHVFEPVKVLGEIKRLLKKGGYAIFLVPSESLVFKIVWFFWTKGKGKIWKGTHLHAYSGDFLNKLVRKVGFEVEEDKKIICGTLHLIKVRKVDR